MHRILLLAKILFRRTNSGRISLNVLLPVLGVSIGVFSISIIFSTMRGLEDDIFNRLKSGRFQSRIYFSSDRYKDQILALLHNKSINSFNGSQKSIGIGNDEMIYSINDVFGIENLEEYYGRIDRESIINYRHGAIIGSKLASSCGVLEGSYTTIYDFDSYNLFTGLPNTHNLIVSNIFTTGIDQFDSNLIFIENDILVSMFDSYTEMIFCDSNIETALEDKIKEIDPNVQIIRWMDDHNEFVNAMNLEKILYSLFGFMIIIISGFTMSAILNLAIIEKIKDIAILRTLGAGTMHIKLMFMTYILAVAFIGSFISFIFCTFSYFMNEKYLIIKNMLSLDRNIPLSFTVFESLLIIICTVVILTMSGYFSMKRASKVDPASILKDYL